MKFLASYWYTLYVCNMLIGSISCSDTQNYKCPFFKMYLPECIKMFITLVKCFVIKRAPLYLTHIELSILWKIPNDLFSHSRFYRFYTIALLSSLYLSHVPIEVGRKYSLLSFEGLCPTPISLVLGRWGSPFTLVIFGR